MKGLKYLLFLLPLTACIRDSQLKPIDPYDIFYGQSSRVWLLKHLYKNGQDYAPLSVEFKEIIIFHASRNCYVHRLKDIGEKKGKKAYFRIDMPERLLQIHFAKEIWRFYMTEIRQDRIQLKPIKGSKFDYAMVLTPLPEF